MNCTGCGHEGVELHATCGHCGAPAVDPADDLQGLRFEPELSAPGRWVPGRGRTRTTPGSRVVRGGDFVEMLDDDAIEVGEQDLDMLLAANSEFYGESDGPPFRIDDDLFAGINSGAAAVPDTAPVAADVADQGGCWPEPCGALPEFVGALSGSGGEQDLEAGGEPIIDRYEEVPENHWAPEIAGLGRRALALLMDQLLLIAVLGIFFLGAFMALRLNGFDTGLFLAADGLQASALPFALLAGVLGLVYFSYFHGTTGRTPGKALVGIEVRAAAAGALSWNRTILRWLGAVLGLACAGVGISWAVFEPRRRGWADLISGTVVVRPRRETAVDVSRR